MNCINCGINTIRNNTIGMHLLQDDAILSLIQQWTAPLTVSHSDHICGACWNLANDTLGPENRGDGSTILGHQRVCIYCGRSVLRTRFHLVRTDSEREQRIQEVVEEWILPRQIGSQVTYLCHSCWVRANRAAPQFVSNKSTSLEQNQGVRSSEILHSRESSETITLPNFIRPVASESHCFVQGCERRERNRVPVSVRKHLLSTYNYYVPINNRLCDYYLNSETWDFLNRNLDRYINVFTAAHVEDMLQVLGHHMLGYS